MNAYPREIIVDNFAGGGGASIGLEQALGRPVDVAINHDPIALAMHQANHPQTHHIVQNICAVDPVDACQGQKVAVAWFSPDCTHHSKAAGGRPRSKRVRDLAWVVAHWAERVRPRIIFFENVEEICTWGPLCALISETTSVCPECGRAYTADKDCRPCPDCLGMYWEQLLRRLKKAGYKLETRQLVASHHGAPTIRKRLYMVARCDGFPIVWPEATHGPGTGKPFRTAAECIDWTIPCPSIFGRPKDLVDATHRRLARGLRRFVLESPKPFIVPITHAGERACHSVDEPFRTITTANRGELALAVPYTIGLGGRAAQSRPRGVDEPMATITAKADAAIAVPFITKFNENSTGQELSEPLDTVMAGAPRFGLVTPFVQVQTTDHPGGPVDEPLHTITTGGQHHLAAAYTIPHHGEREGQQPRCMSVEDPFPVLTPSNNPNLVAAWLAQHNGGSTGHAAEDPFSTVTGRGVQQQLVAAYMNVMRNNMAGRDLEELCPTVLTNNHLSLVCAWLNTYYRTDQASTLHDPLPCVTTRDRFGLATIDLILLDLGMRMFTARELFNGNGFPGNYILDPIYNGKPLSKTAQIRCVGNSVCPDVARALVAANYTDMPVAPLVFGGFKPKKTKEPIGQRSLL